MVLVSNELEYDDPRVTTIKVGKDTTWSANLYEVLHHHIKTKYILLLLDDFIINAPVNDERFIELLSLIYQHHTPYIEIVEDEAVFSNGFEKNKKLVGGIDGVIRRSRNSTHRNRLQASIWDTHELKNLLRSEESVWDFENMANERTVRVLHNII